MSASESASESLLASETPEVDIEEDDVPLGVEDEEDDTDTEDTEVLDIEDEDTPLGSGGNGKDRPWLWWILVAIASAVTGKTITDKKKKAMKVIDENTDDTKQ